MSHKRQDKPSYRLWSGPSHAPIVHADTHPASVEEVLVDAHKLATRLQEPVTISLYHGTTYSGIVSIVYPSPEMRWQPITTAPENRFVLVACEGQASATWVYFTARLNEHHSRWENEDGYALSVFGYTPLYWSALPIPPDHAR